MNHLEYLLTVLGEECAEVIQRASKAIRFGMAEVQPGQHENNRRRLERELADVAATVELLGLEIREEDKAAKREKLTKFMAYSESAGTLTSAACSKCGLPTDSLSGICSVCSCSR